MSVQVSIKKQAVLGILLVLIALAVVEGIVRTYEFFFLGCRPSVSDAYKNMNYLLVRQICTDVRFTQFDIPDVVSNKPNQHMVTVNINSYGIRGPEFPIEKPDGVYRIIIIGGSTTYGHGTSSDDTTIPGYVQKLFDKEKLPVKVHVINAGVDSLYSFTETYHLKNKLMRFEPDLIVNYGGANDADLYIPNPHVKTPEAYQEEEQSFKFRDYPFYRTPFAIFSIFFAKQYKAETFAERINPTEEVVSTWKQRWMDFCDYARDKKIKTLIVVQPGLGTGDKPLSPDEKKYFDEFDEHSHRTLTNLEGMANSLPEMANHCDATADLRRTLDGVDEPIYWDAFHMADFGNEIVAKKLYQEILPLVLNDLKEKNLLN